MNKIFFLLIMIISVATSCKKHLSRIDAKKQIVSAENYPVIVDYDFTKAFTKDENTEGNGVTVILDEEEFKKQKQMLDMFEASKLIVFEEEPHREESTLFLLGTTVRTWTTVKISLSDEGKKYLIREDDEHFKVKLWEAGLDEITGVQEMQQQKTAKVDYTISNKNITPFGDRFSDKNKITQKTIYFSLFDDGWRINK